VRSAWFDVERAISEWERNLGPMNDPYLWLEDVTGDAALDWVRERNSDSIGRYASDAGFTDLQQQIRAILDTDARIPIVTPRGEYIYNYWKDGEHPRGLWRRTTMDSYPTEEPSWDVLIDLDAPAAAEGENWVWASAQVLHPTRTGADPHCPAAARMLR
jgi:prolyl oligopeptidase